MPAVLNGLAAAAVAFCALVLLRSMGVQLPTLEFVDASRVVFFASQALAAIALVAGLAWSRAHSAGLVPVLALTDTSEWSGFYSVRTSG